MPSPFRIEVISTGEELLLGQTVDTNANWIAGRLFDLGHKLSQVQVVGDSAQDIANALEQARLRAKVVLVTGGLGPTVDDITLETAARHFGRSLVLHQEWVDRVKAVFEAMGRTYTDNNKKQAYLPEGGLLLANANGTAPGCQLEVNGSHFFFMPGVPREMKPMFDEHVAPWIQTTLPSPPFLLRKFRVFGIPESTLERRIQPALDVLTDEERGVTELAYRVQFPEIEFKLACRAPSEASRVMIAAKLDLEFERILGDHLISRDGSGLVQRVPQALTAANLTLSVAESCTGGLLGGLLTEAAGASAFFLGGALTYHNRLKAHLLNVPREMLLEHGAVSGPVAESMAVGTRVLAESDLGISITGVAGPDGGTAAKPVGTVFVALADATGVRSRRFNFLGDRAWIRNFSAYTALFALWRYLRHDRDLDAGLGS